MARENQAYLIRLQRNHGNEPWRASLKNAHTGESLRFANEREMLRYLLGALSDGSHGLEKDKDHEG